jgi:hypothetical protein
LPVAGQHLFEPSIVLQHRNAVAVKTGFQSLQALEKNHFHIRPCPADVSVAAKHPEPSCCRDYFPADFVTGIAFELLQNGGRRWMRVFIEPGNSWLSVKRTMPPDAVPVVNIGRQVIA